MAHLLKTSALRPRVRELYVHVHVRVLRMHTWVCNTQRACFCVRAYVRVRVGVSTCVGVLKC